MKAKRKSGSRKKPHPKKSVKKKSGGKVKTRMKPATTKTALPPSSEMMKVKTCEEVEIGDIGGFGSTEELESHENRCAQPATQLCASCGRNLCGAHYELLHRDHDSGQRSENRESLARA